MGYFHMSRPVESIFGAVVTAPHQIPYTFTAVGGETSISLPVFPVTGLVTIGGGVQVPLDNYEIEGNVLHLGGPLDPGDVVYCLFDKVLSPEGQNSTTRIYKFKSAGGETSFTPDFTSYGVQSLYIDGKYQTPIDDYTYNKETGVINLTSAIVGAGKWVVAELYVQQNYPALAAPDGSDMIGAQLTVAGSVYRTVQDKLQEVVSVKDFGAKGDGVTDDAPAFRAAIASNRKLIVPYGVYLFDSSLGLVPGVASAPCVVIDGVHDFTIEGVGTPIILMGPNMAATPGNSFILGYVSAASASSGNYTKRIKISNLFFKYSRNGVNGNISGVNVTSLDESEVSDCSFDGRGMSPTLGIPGTGSRRTKLLRNKFYGITTCFDNSQFIECTVEDNQCDAAGESVVTGIGHFYDTNTLANIRLDPAPAPGLGSGNIYHKNTIVGYGSPISIRGMRDSLISKNKIHSSIFNDDTIRNMISLYTETKEVAAGFNSGNIAVTDNIIFNCKNTKNTTASFRGVFVNRTGGPFDNPLIANNIISGLFGGTGPHIGISIDGITNGDVVANNSVSAATPYGRGVVMLQPGSGDGLSPSVVASSGDLILKAETGRFVRFGTKVTVSDSPIVGYITIRDDAGTERRLALIA